MCNWVLNFLTGSYAGGEGRKQHLHFADPQHWGPTTMHTSNSIIKFADDPAVVCLITNNDEKYREEVRALGVWCQENNLSPNVNKTKELIVDFSEQQREHPPFHINVTAVETVDSFKFLGVHITDKLKWSTHTDSVVKKAQQRLFNLRRLKKDGLAPKTLTNFYRCTMATARLCRGWCGLHNASQGAKYLPSRTPTAPDVTGRPKRSLRTTTTRATACHPTIIQKARSVQMCQKWDRETVK